MTEETSVFTLFKTFLEKINGDTVCEERGVR